ncbi:MAG: hypothetical protein DPW09_33610 [Anaerolineae bacterium]|nr:hypothetical protein [Anaerolineales bacterium]MCQ3978391.1 hypothetical protein [Anaerolineae bacterium]
MNKNSSPPLPPPDKSIPLAVGLIGSFEIAIALLGLIIAVLVGNFDGNTVAYLTLLLVYGAMGAGLLAIQEWARFANVVLHLVAIPYTFYTAAFLGAPADWRMISQVLISIAIVVALTRPALRYKFQTVVPKKKDH